MNHSKKRTKPFALVLATLLVAAVLPTTAAYATNWGPLASYYNGSKVVSGSGTFKDYAATHARTTYVIKDDKADGNTVYGHTSYQFWRVQADGKTYGYLTETSRSTTPFQNTTKTQTTQISYRTDSEKVRGLIQVCAEMGWPVPNSCSDTAFKSYSY